MILIKIILLASSHHLTVAMLPQTDSFQNGQEQGHRHILHLQSLNAGEKASARVCTRMGTVTKSKYGVASISTVDATCSTGERERGLNIRVCRELEKEKNGIWECERANLQLGFLNNVAQMIVLNQS